MALDVAAITDAIVSPVAASGLVVRVFEHEPKSAPAQDGISAAVWFTGIWPFSGGSGLDQTSACVTFMIRIYTGMLAEPQDSIDPDMLDATSRLINLFGGDFELGGNVRNVDIFGEARHGELSAVSGYINQDHRLMRVVDLTLPIIVSDVWPQVA
jgi:hypothetical protein